MLGTVAALGLLLASFEVRMREQSLRDHHREQAGHLVEAAAIACIEPLLIDDYPVVQTFVEQLKYKTQRLLSARVYDARGRIVARVGQSSAADVEEMATVSKARIFPPGRADHHPIGHIEIKLSSAHIDNEVREMWNATLRTTIAMILVAGLILSLVLFRVIGRPLEKLASEAMRLSQGNFDSAVDFAGPRDLEQLGAALENLRVGVATTQRAIEVKNVNLEELNRVKSDFVATMSHELRTPLNGVIGFAHELFETELDAEQHDMVQTLVESADCLLDLIGDILDFSRMQADSLELEERALSPHDLAAQVVRMAEPMAHAKGIALRLFSVIPSDLYVLGDRKRMRQILLNLITNAIKFTDEGFVELEVAATSGANGRIDLECHVRDSGIGISPEALPYIFDAFRQQDSSFSRRFGGSGLGLAICQQLATLMGGGLTASSAVGKGSDFRFTASLPVTDKPEATDVESVAQCDLEGLHVLLAEDDPINEKLVRVVLEKLGARVSVARNGREAIEAFDRELFDIDLVLMDCQMPECDGFEATHAIRARERGAAIPIVGCTANATSHDEQRCLDAGMNDYISKPIQRARLLEVLAKWTKSSREARESALS